jgi:hypothetical protein
MNYQITTQTHNFLSPESHLRMIKAAVVIMATHPVDKTVPTVCFTFSTDLELFVGMQLFVCTGVVTWRNIILSLPLLRLDRNIGFSLTWMELSLACKIYYDLTMMSLISRATARVRA